MINQTTSARIIHLRYVEYIIFSAKFEPVNMAENPSIITKYKFDINHPKFIKNNTAKLIDAKINSIPIQFAHIFKLNNIVYLKLEREVMILFNIFKPNE